MVGAFTFGLNWVRIPAPKSQKARRSAVLSPKMKTGLALIFGASTLIASALAVVQGLRGYPPLTPDQLSRESGSIPTQFYTVTGKPMLDAMYDMSGSDGQYVLLPRKCSGRLSSCCPTDPNPMYPFA